MQQHDAKGQGGAGAIPPALLAMMGTGTLDDLVREIPQVERNIARARRKGEVQRERNLTQLLRGLRARRAQLQGKSVPPRLASLCSRAELLDFRRRIGCTDCTASIPCKAHESMDLAPRCHPKAGLRVSYHFPTNLVRSCCRVCGSPFPDFLVAETLPEVQADAASEARPDRSPGAPEGP